MSRNRVRFTVEEVLAHLNGDFDIPDEGVNSNVEWLDDEEFKSLNLFCLRTQSLYPMRRRK